MFQLAQNTLYDWAGYLGVGFYLASYALLQMGLVRGSHYPYAIMNLIAASLVLLSLSVKFNLSAAIIQIMWIIISTFGICRLYVIERTTRFNENELRLINDVLYDMPKPLARKFLNRGIWIDADVGTELTREGEEVENLIYLLSGRADVISQRKSVASIKGGFIGEMNVLQPGPASATVIIDQPALIFTASGEALRKTASTDSEFRAYLQEHLALATRTKLIEANSRLLQSEQRK